MTRDKQLELTAQARDHLLVWSSAAGIPLSRVEFVYPFVATDFSLSVWLFYDTDVNVARSARDGSTDRLQREFVDRLARVGYDQRWLEQIEFVVDSHENVVRNYDGSYFYRLR
jgi:hypothetical protein